MSMTSVDDVIKLFWGRKSSKSRDPSKLKQQEQAILKASKIVKVYFCLKMALFLHFNERSDRITNFLKMVQPWPLFIYFRLSKHTLQFLQQIHVKKCPSSIWCWDSNSQPLEHESTPITTRPGLQPNITNFLKILYFVVLH